MEVECIWDRELRKSHLANFMIFQEHLTQLNFELRRERDRRIETLPLEPHDSPTTCPETTRPSGGRRAGLPADRALLAVR